MNNDIIYEIFTNLPITTLNSCSLVNSQFNHIFHQPILWKKLSVDNDFINKVIVDHNYRSAYIKYYLINKLKDKLNLTETVYEIYNLEKLWLQARKLTSIPNEIGQLINLHYLRLEDNQVTIIPNEIGQLVNLKYLFLENNQLTSIPNEIGRLVNLQYLHLHNNQLTSIPNEIGQLINLQYLYLHNNQLNRIPKEICQLVNLNELSLYNNQLKIHKLSKGILDYLLIKQFGLGRQKIDNISISRLFNLL